MALQLMKLQVVVNTSTTVGPDPAKFFYVTTSDTAAGSTLTINTEDFFDDTGAVASTLPVLAVDNSYTQVFINGVLQMDGISVYTAGAAGTGSLAITVPVGDEAILANSPIVLKVVNYVPASESTVET